MSPLIESVPVAIVGGGEVGLATSILLSLQGIEHVLFERQASTSPFPKAIGMHNRTMEIFRKMGMEDLVNQHAAPPESYERTAWVTSFGDKGRTIASREAVGYELSDSNRGRAYKQASPSRYSNLAQIRLEPLLRKRAEELNPGRILFHHEVTAVSESPTHSTVTYHARSGPSQDHQTISATYVVGADGGRFITEHIGMHWVGESDIMDMVTAHIRAPLSQHVPDPGVLLYWFINPELGGSTHSGIVYHLGPYPRTLETEEYSVLFARLPHEREKPFTKEDALKRMEKMFRIPDLPIEIMSLSHWYLQAKAASNYISPEGRIFLVGDSSHRIPPWGALGGNTGFQDTDNLVWKLAIALKNDGKMNMSGLLRSYDEERRPVGNRVAKSALENMRAHGGILDRALGVSPINSAEENVAALDEYFAACANGGTPEGKAKAEAVRKAAQETLDIEFFALGAEAGWFYNHSHLVEEEDWKSPQVRSDGEFEICEYYPCTVPGHQLPHAWLSDNSGERTSTRHLVARDRLLLLTSSSCWRAAIDDTGLVDLVVIDEESSKWKDLDGQWAKQREIAPSGAVLVRPDNIVAWRWKDGRMLKQNSDPAAELARVVKKVLRMDGASSS